MIPTYDEVMLPLLKVISNKEVYTNKQVEEDLSKYFNLTDEDRHKELKSGVKIFYDRISWAKTYLKNAKLIEAPKRGTFKISSRGLELLRDDVAYLDSKYLQRYPEFVEFINRGKKKSHNKDETEKSSNEILAISITPMESIDNSYAELRATLAEEILEKLKEVDFYKFEEIVLDLLVKMGYGGSLEEAKESTSRTNDEGIDGIIKEDKLGLDKIYIQAKRWKDTVVSRPVLQGFSGALDTPRANKGIFITTSSFADTAIKYAENLGNKKIILIDGIQLAEYMIDYNVGVTVENTYEIKRIDTDYFVDE